MNKLKTLYQFLNESVSDEEVFSYLNDLRDSGQTNMFGAGAYIEKAFNLDKRKARDLLTKWMKSFDEAKVNEGRRGEYPILSIGPTNLLTGKSKYWNFYDEWLKGGDMTAEIYEPWGKKGKYKIVFTSGKGTIDNIKPGGRREFHDDQTGRFLFDGALVGSSPLKDLKHWANENGIKSGTGYVYK
jgi:hypothetical protein